MHHSVELKDLRFSFINVERVEEDVDRRNCAPSAARWTLLPPELQTVSERIKETTEGKNDLRFLGFSLMRFTSV